MAERKVLFRKMTEEEFRLTRDISVHEYAYDLHKGRGLTISQATAEAEKEFNGALPEGSETEGQHLMMILDAESKEEAGYIWFSYEEEAGIRLVWLNDFFIYENQRRKGYGRSALTEMEKVAGTAGCKRSVLLVWDHNQAGCRLYQSCGYKKCQQTEGGIYMRKEL